MGCGPAVFSGKADEGSGEAKKGAASVVGNYAFDFTAEVGRQLDRDEAALKTLQSKAAAGDKAAQSVVAQIPKNALSQRQLLAKLTLKLRSDSTFVFGMLDRQTGRLRDASGTYELDDSGSKLTLTFQALDGKKAEGADAKTLSMTFDEGARTLTADTGSGPKLVMKKS
jgi:hypothetical protein